LLHGGKKTRGKGGDVSKRKGQKKPHRKRCRPTPVAKEKGKMRSQEGLGGSRREKTEKSSLHASHWKNGMIEKERRYTEFRSLESAEETFGKGFWTKGLVRKKGSVRTREKKATFQRGGGLDEKKQESGVFNTVRQRGKKKNSPKKVSKSKKPEAKIRSQLGFTDEKYPWEPHSQRAFWGGGGIVDHVSEGKHRGKGSRGGGEESSGLETKREGGFTERKANLTRLRKNLRKLRKNPKKGNRLPNSGEKRRTLQKKGSLQRT